MADLNEIKSLGPMARKQMESDEWTVEQLATANWVRLTTYRGVGTLTAQRIVGEAQELVNQERLAQAEAQDGPGVVEQAEMELPAASARVKRIRGGS